MCHFLLNKIWNSKTTSATKTNLFHSGRVAWCVKWNEILNWIYTIKKKQKTNSSGSPIRILLLQRPAAKKDEVSGSYWPVGCYGCVSSSGRSPQDGAAHLTPSHRFLAESLPRWLLRHLPCTFINFCQIKEKSCQQQSISHYCFLSLISPKCSKTKGFQLGLGLWGVARKHWL